MEISLLETKFIIPPPRPALVSRSRLLERLQEGLGYSLVLVSAPAGFGKTTLLSEWAQQSTQRTHTAWVSLDEADNDPIRFWYYIIAALQKIQPGCGEKILPWLHSSQPPSTESILNTLINELSHLKGHLFIALDDYHLITSQPIHDGISYLIEHLPAYVHLVIASRADPPLPLVRFRGKGTMLELHTDDLRFTTDETTSLMKVLKIPVLTAKNIAALDERTEGWAVGLKMAALSMKGRKDVTEFITAYTGDQRYIMDYLMEEVLQNQSSEVCEFLLKTSVLNRLTASLCDSLTGRKDSRNILLRFERDHLFIMLLDESRQWYRYEHLFADLLRHQCEMTYGTEQVAALHRQASQWYEDNALPDEAVNHALAARDWERSIRLISTLYEERRILGEFDTLLNWLKTIPDERLREHLRLYSQNTILLAETGHLDRAERALNYLETVVHDDTIRGEMAFAQGAVYRHRGNIESCLEMFEKAFSLLPLDEIAIRSRVAARITHARQRWGPLLEAEKWATLTSELGQQTKDISVVGGALSQLGIIVAYQGKLKRAIELYKKANELFAQTAWAGNHFELCIVYYILNNLKMAEEHARLTIVSSELTGGVVNEMTGYYYHALICLINGDEAEADTTMESMDQVSCHPLIDASWYANYIASRVMYAIRRDNLEEATRWGEQFPDTARIMRIDRYVPARLLLAQGKKEVAARLLHDLYDEFIEVGALLLATRVRIYQALASDNEEQALEYLAEALIMSEPEGVIRFFVDEAKLLKPLLEKALKMEITPEFTKKLLNIIKAEEQQCQHKGKEGTVSPIQGLLSKRELEVLGFLVEGFSNRQIADRLIISQGTVKTHVHNIFEKLNAQSRTQVVSRARELKLI